MDNFTHIAIIIVGMVIVREVYCAIFRPLAVKLWRSLFGQPVDNALTKDALSTTYGKAAVVAVLILWLVILVVLPSM